MQLSKIPQSDYLGAVEHASQLLSQQSGLPIQEWRVRLMVAGRQRSEHWATEDGLTELVDTLDAMTAASNESLLLHQESGSPANNSMITVGDYGLRLYKGYVPAIEVWREGRCVYDVPLKYLTTQEQVDAWTRQLADKHMGMVPGFLDAFRALAKVGVKNLGVAA